MFAQTPKEKMINNKFSAGWEVKLNKIFDVGRRRVKRYLRLAKTVYDDPWDKKLDKIIHQSRNYNVKNPWRTKFNNFVSGWNIWCYKIKGCAPTINLDGINKTKYDWQSRFRFILRKLDSAIRNDPWVKKCSTLRKMWADTEKEIKGGRIVWTR